MEFPVEMQKERRWCAWFYEKDHKHDRWVKVPYDLNKPKVSERAKTDTPTTWGKYQQAECAVDFFKDHPEYVKARVNSDKAGAGFMVGGGWAFLDLDHIPTVIADYSLGEHNLISEVMELLDHTYCEVSQSQEGLHFIFKVEVPHKDLKKRGERNGNSVELYDSERFAALTGNVLEADQPLKITTITAQQWEQLHKLVFGECEPRNSSKADYSKVKLSQGGGALSNEALEIVWKILTAKNKDGSLNDDHYKMLYWLTADLPTVSTNVSGQEFPDWNGELKYYDPSSQDQICCNMLAFWTHDNSELMDEIIRHTHLYRPKWERQDYSKATIQSAINHHQRGLQQSFTVTVKDGSIG